MLGLGLGLNRTIGRVRPKNEVVYNPITWAEWEDKTGIVKDPDGITLSNSGSSIYTKTTISVKPSAQCGILCTVVSSSMSSNTFYLGGGGIGSGVFQDVPMSKTVGNQKKITMSRSEGGSLFYIQNVGTATESITVKDIRVFELPAGSQIEADFTNLTADQLNAKYPF